MAESTDGAATAGAHDDTAHDESAHDSNRTGDTDTPHTEPYHAKHVSVPAYETVALVLQGGGALGAYQAGVYQGLEEAGIEANWLAGISIGALNTALIAGNPPELRLARLVEFWDLICTPAYGISVPSGLEHALFNATDFIRKGFTTWQAMQTVLEGQKGFFTPRMPPPTPLSKRDPTTASWYDTRALKATLERLCDFDRINDGGIRVSVGAVNVKSGNFAYFDNTKQRLRAEHFMASGALPPGFAAVEIDGEYYWDGGLMSNTPLSRVLQTTPRRDTLAFQVDLWSAIGPVPDNLTDVGGRQKDIQYSSRTRLVTDMLQRSQRFRHVLHEVLSRVPPEVRETDHWCRVAEELACSKRYNVIHLIYQAKEYDGHFKDFQFGHSTMREHWSAGLADTRATLVHPEWLDFPDNEAGFITHDVHRDLR